MADVSQQQIETALANYVDPYLQKDLVAAKVVKNIRIDGDKVTVEFGFPTKGYNDTLTQQLQANIAVVPGVGSVTVQITNKIAAHAVQKGVNATVQKGVNAISGVKNIIAVASG